MIDPFTLATGLAGLISLVKDLTDAAYSCYNYGKSVKNASEEIKDVTHELNLLKLRLEYFRDAYSNAGETLPSSAGIAHAVEDCKDDIENFCQQLNPEFKGFHGTLSRLKWPTKKEKVSEFLSKLQRYRGIFDSAKLDDLVLGVKTIVTLEEKRLDALENEKEQFLWKELLDWLSPLNLRDLDALQREIYKVRRAGSSSTWILRDPKFQEWRDGMPPTLLWCRGDPGVGKTIIR
jgi:hypothetical protein